MNNNLEAYYNAWDKFVKSWIVIKIKDPSCVYQWRLQVGNHVALLAHEKLVFFAILEYINMWDK